ncbi:MAG: DUF1294 domain-containing protein [bacterium]|nr:DUF1294 domain-containing protein [bacterium]
MRTRKIPLGHLFVLLGLLTLPTIAAVRLAESFDWWIIAGAGITISLLAYWLVAADKAKAQRREWRTPESTLHLFEILGGWPGSYLAQRRFRHKTRKGRYQTTFWAVVVFHQILAFDYFRDWQIARMVIDGITGMT